MTKIALFVNKSIDENAAYYFERAKLAKKKLEGARQTLTSFKKKRDDEQESQSVDATPEIQVLQKDKRRWYEKFKWFVSSEGFLVVGARDATTNEVLVKKYTQANDLVFHTDMAGSPFVIIKKDSSDVRQLLGDAVTLPDVVGEATLEEAASFTAIHSKAWKLGLGSTNVFYVAPDQVTKEANSGEYMAKGSFMIRGKTTYVTPIMSLSAGLVLANEEEGTEPFFLAGPTRAVEQWAEHTVLVEQGSDKSSDVAKTIRQRIQASEHISLPVDEIIRQLPSGGCQVKKERKRKSDLNKK